MLERDTILRENVYKVMELSKSTVNGDKYRQKYHIMPPVGLLNDPNGLIHFNSIYHLFFQWMPFKTGHGSKFWGHYTSSDLLNWTLEPIALTPSEWYEKDGCYSGSAIEYNGKMLLFYTGNVEKGGNREAYQCMAESEDGITFSKKGVVINLPEGFTSHFRDPKVFKHDKSWYIVIGAQTNSLEGNIALYESYDLKSWCFKGTIINYNDLELRENGYMYECPDLFKIEDTYVLLFSPQGIKPEGIKYQNVYQTGYISGKMDFNNSNFNHGKFIELDKGFEFYAPQTTLDSKGRRLMFGWMGVPDQYENLHPTHKHKWIHNMTIPRELKLKNGKIYQSPVEELKNMRKNEIITTFSINKDNTKSITLNIITTEIIIDILTLDSKSSFTINLFNTYAYIIYNPVENTLSLKRKHLNGKNFETRSCFINKLSKLHLFIDNSSLEIFINEGEEVFTSRIFPDHNNKDITFKTENDVTLKVKIWEI